MSEALKIEWAKERMIKRLFLALVVAGILLGTWLSAMNFKKVSPRKKPTQEITPEQMPPIPHGGEVKRPTSKQTTEMLSEKALTPEGLLRC